MEQTSARETFDIRQRPLVLYIPYILTLTKIEIILVPHDKVALLIG